MRRFKQVFTFIQGMNSDIEDAKLNGAGYRLAVNRQLVEEGGLMALTSFKGDTEVAAGLIDPDHRYHSEFPCTATYGPNKELRESVVSFSYNSLGNGEGAIYILDTTTDTLHKIYDDAQRPTTPANPRSVNLDLGDEIDAFYLLDQNDAFLYWIDGKNPIRYINLHVNDPSIYDNSVAPNSPLYIANECDLLYAQRLYPANLISAASSEPTGGDLVTGSYQFAFRYYNSQTQRYSAWSYLTEPFSVIADDISQVNTNDIEGYVPGSRTSQSITIALTNPHFHATYYDSVQVAVVKNIGGLGATPQVDLLRPSTDYYNNLVFSYTGAEAAESFLMDDLVIEDSPIETARTLEYHDGRIYIGNIKYKDLSINPVTTVTAETFKDVIPVPVDVMTNSAADNQGYYDPSNANLRKGYFREEVYRFGRTYVDKFGNWGRPVPFDFSEPALRYDEGNHSTTWQLNHASDGIDWKFLDRQSQEGCLFAQGSDAIEPIGLRLSDVDNHPEWAYGVAIVRLPRKKNILGQTPVINGVAFQGNGFSEGFNETDWADFFTLAFYENSAGFDYNGAEDYFGPKIMAMGAAKNLTYGLFQTGTNARERLPYLIWEILGHKEYGNVFLFTQHGGQSQENIKKRNNAFLFLYPLEYMANAAGQQDSGIKLDGTEYLKVIDLVALKSFNAFRDVDAAPGADFGNSPTQQDIQNFFVEGRQNRYAWIYGVAAKEAYYYYNGHNPRNLLTPNSSVSALNPVVNVAPINGVRIAGGFTFDWGHPEEILDGAFSNDPAMQHIRKLTNGTKLGQVQTQNDSTLWYDQKMYPPGVVTGQRCLAVYMDLDEDNDGTNLNFIYDPNYFLYENYINGTPQFLWANLFGGQSEIDARAVQEDYVAQNFTDADWDTARGDFEKNTVIAPGSSVCVYVANIERGLGDNRYGVSNQAQNYIFTGAHRIINKADIDANTPLSFDVMGGDCYITRLIAQVRDNASRKGTAPITDPANHYIDVAPNKAVRDAQKATTFGSFIEIIDMWVESTVNGHYIYHGRDAYPTGIETRDPNTADWNVTPSFQYPLQSGITKYQKARRYFYDHGHSLDNIHKVLPSKDELESDILRLMARFHFSTQKIINATGAINFDQFRPLDFYDLQPTAGPIAKIIHASRERHIIVQHDGIFMVYLGKTLAEGADGNQIALTSGANVIGYGQYLSDNNEAAGDMGGQFLRAIRKADGVIYIADFKRNKIVAVAGGLKDISYADVQDFVSTNIMDRYENINPKNVFSWWDNIRKRIVFGKSGDLDDPAWGISRLTGLNLWEGAIRVFRTQIADVVTNGQSTYAFIRDEGTEVSRILKLYSNDDRSEFMGQPNDSYIDVVVNNSEHRHKPKVLSNVVVDGGTPSAADTIVVREDGVDHLSFDAPFTERMNSFVATQFRDLNSPGRRVRDANILVRIKFAAQAIKSKVSGIIATYRTDQRENG